MHKRSDNVCQDPQLRKQDPALKRRNQYLKCVDAFRVVGEHRKQPKSEPTLLSQCNYHVASVVAIQALTAAACAVYKKIYDLTTLTHCRLLYIY